MRVILFGATGMIGQGVLHECLSDPRVDSVLAIGRSRSGQDHPKLRQLTRTDFFDYRDVLSEITGYDACFFCLGVSSAGMSEPDYDRVTRELTLAAATALGERNPGIVFCYVSGVGADSSETGRVMWARVRGKLENELLRMPSISALIFRPGYVHPMKGIRSRTALYNLFYTFTKPLYPVLRRIAPAYVTTTVNMGRAMIAAAVKPPAKRVLENPDINALAEAV
jgi:uncharacterized protein YbjT (DUF2867 family)